MSKYAPKRDDGLMAYVVETLRWGSTKIEWCESLKEARDLYQTKRTSVRRALADEVRP